MDGKEYINSGILELYCLGSLLSAQEEEVRKMMVYPEVREELHRIQAAIEAYATEHAIPPPAYLTDEINALFNNLEKENHMHHADLPLLNKYSDYRIWLELVKNNIPQPLNEPCLMKELTGTATLTQMLVVTSVDVPDEVHTNEQESFLILQGECMCIIGDTVVHMKAGSFIEIPLYTHHNVTLVSNYVVAIMQRIAV